MRQVFGRNGLSGVVDGQLGDALHAVEPHVYRPGLDRVLAGVFQQGLVISHVFLERLPLGVHVEELLVAALPVHDQLGQHRTHALGGVAVQRHIRAPVGNGIVAQAAVYANRHARIGNKIVGFGTDNDFIVCAVNHTACKQ